MVKIKNKTANKLVFYHGGGYDGCFWEWNFFLFNSNGEFHNVFTSGRNGVSDKSEALEVMSSEDHVYVYDLSKLEDIEEFQREHNVTHVVGLVQKINNGEYGELPEVWFECDHCGKHETETGHVDGWHGCGGIAVTADDKYCEECHANGICEDCGEFDLQLLKDGKSLCEYCYEQKVDMFFNNQDGVYLVFDKMNNKWIEEDIAEHQFNDMDIPGETLFKIDVNTREGRKIYFINGIDEKAVVSDLHYYLNGNYYEISESVAIDEELLIMD